jgi:hypothetical protein
MRDRRDFLRGTLLGATGTVLAPTLLDAIASELRAGQYGPDTSMDESALRFWTEQVRKPRAEAHGLFGKKPQMIVGKDDCTGEFIFIGADRTFRSVDEIEQSELLPSGDISARVNVHGFRPSTTDTERFAKIQSGSLRIDIQQQKPFMPFMDVMAWTAVGGLFPGNTGKLPPISELKFDPGQGWGKMQTVPLPGGSGAWTFNFFLQKRESFLNKFVGMAITNAAQFSPAIGLPGIAQTALKSFDKLFGFLQAQAHTEWLLKMTDLPVFGTKEAATSVDRTSALPLVSGDYLIIPRYQLTQFESNDWKDLELRRGFLVPKNTPPKEIFVVAKDIHPTLTYISVNVDIKKA